MAAIARAICLAVLAGLTGCASVTSGTTQAVTVTAVCEGAIVNAASCILANDKGRWDVVTPGPIVIQKSHGDLTLACRKGESTGTATFVSKANSGAWGNIIAGGLIGYAIDSGSGAAFNYPSELPVVLAAPCPQT